MNFSCRQEGKICYDVRYMKLIWLPNFISYLRIFLVAVFIASFFYSDTALPLSLALIIIVSDAIDGAIARGLHVESKLGSLLDSIADALFVFSSFFIFSLLLGFDFFVIALLARFLMLVLFMLFLLSKKQWTAQHFIGNKIAAAAHYGAIVYILLGLFNYLDFSYSSVLLLIAIHYIGMLLAFIEFAYTKHSRI